MTERDLKRLLKALLETSPQQHPVDPESLLILELSGSFSGAFVALVWVDGLPTLILKAGPSERVLKEVERRRMFAGRFQVLDELGLTGCSEPVDVEVDGRDEPWRVMAYPYVGGLTYYEATRYSDFESIFQEFVAPRSDAMHIGAESLQDWALDLFMQIKDQEITDTVSNTAHGVRHRPLASYLPSLPWSEGLSALLCTAAVFVPEGEELLNLREWWVHTSRGHTIAPLPNETMLHGDLRFANVLVNRRGGQVGLVDFGGVGAGHVFRDLARFECDLLVRVTPPGPDTTRALRLYPEERRTTTLERAFSRQFAPPDDPLDPDNTHLKALQILRGVYDGIWHISHHEGGQQMYLWFLMAEILKRLLWTEPVFSGADGRRALLRSVIMLKRAIMGSAPTAPNFAAVSQLSALLGCREVYVPTREYRTRVNKDRNAAKIAALQEAARTGQHVRLIAETGNAYLHFHGPFFPELENLLERGSLSVVLVNPWFVESHGISAAFNDPAKLDEQGMHEWHRTKFMESFWGCQSLSQRAAGRLQVRVARYGLSSTILTTDDVVFFEPYFRSDRTKRYERRFDTFEMRFEPGTEHVRNLLDEHFDFYWRTGTPLDSVMANEEGYRRLLRELQTLW
jgi:hypothetical protein